MTNPLIIGIDPGLSGAIAVIHCDKSLSIYDMPVLEILRNGKKKREIDAAGLSRFLKLFRIKQAKAFVEKVGAMPGQGVTSMFSFGRSYGTILGILAAHEIETHHVIPQRWVKALEVKGGRDGSRLRACELAPTETHWFSRVKDDGRAEAFLIAKYGENMVEQGLVL